MLRHSKELARVARLICVLVALFAREATKVDASPRRNEAGAGRGELSAVPQAGPKAGLVQSGVRGLRLAQPRDGLVYVPPSYDAKRPAPLMLVLHGAGADAQDILPPFLDLAELFGVLLLIPDSRGRTWDAIIGDYGPDVRFIDAALIRMFATYNVDPARVVIAGFSDGASYALSLGASNGKLFTHVIAFSPGFMAPARQEGMPRIFVSHGLKDPILPVERCSRRVVPALRGAGYAVMYREFGGGHTMPHAVVRAAFDWLLP